MFVRQIGVDLGRGPGFLGQSKKFAAGAKMQMFNRTLIPHTRFPISDCINQGVMSSFWKRF